MIKSFKNKGLELFFTTGKKSGLQAKHASKLRMQLFALDVAIVVGDMDRPGWRLHPLKGSLEGQWSIVVSGNWRLFFEFTDGNAYVVNYEDYH